MPERVMTLLPPLGGLHRSLSLQSTPPFTSTDLLNCFNRSPFDKRQQLASRPMLHKTFPGKYGEPAATGTKSTAVFTSNYSVITGNTASNISIPGEVTYDSVANVKVVFAFGSTYSFLNAEFGNTNISVQGDATADEGKIFAIRLESPTTGVPSYSAGFSTVTITQFSPKVGQTISFQDTGNSYTVFQILGSDQFKVVGNASGEGSGDTVYCVVDTHTASSITAYSGYTTWTATAGVFTSDMIGLTLTDDSTGNAYEIIGYTSSTVVTLAGDASGEAGAFTVETTGSPIQCMTVLRSPTAEWSQATFDDFSTGLSNWTQANTLGWGQDDADAGRSVVVNEGIIEETTAWTHPAAVVYTAISQLSDSITYDVEVFVGQNLQNDNYGTIRLYTQMDNTSPNPSVTPISGNALVLELSRQSSNCNWALFKVVSGTKTTLASGSSIINDPAPTGWLKLTIDGVGNVASCSFSGATLAENVAIPATPAGHRIGIGLANVKTSHSHTGSLLNVPRVTALRVTAHTGRSDPNATRRFMIVDGVPWIEFNIGTFTRHDDTDGANCRSSGHINAVQRAGKIYIADYDDAPKKDTTTDGVIAATSWRFSSAGVSNWNTLATTKENLIANYVIEIRGSTSLTTQNGVYAINSVENASPATYVVLGYMNGSTNTVHPGSSTNETGLTYRVLRGPKIYDPDDDSLYLWLPDLYDDGSFKGYVPVGCPLIARFNSRMKLGGAAPAPHVSYYSRDNDPLDWDNDSPDGDTGQAVAGTDALQGVIGNPLTAYIPYRDDYFIDATRNELYVTRGDPSGAGPLPVSETIGVVSDRAWCNAPDGSVPFLSADGLYVLPADASVLPVPLSRDKLPEELLDIQAAQYTPVMAFDVLRNGVWLFVTAVATGVTRHWFIDWETKALMPIEVPEDMEPTAILQYPGTDGVPFTVLLGGRDGSIREFSEDATDDDGIEMSSYAWIGPFRLWNDEVSGIVKSVGGTLAEPSGDVDYEIYVGNTAEAALESEAFSSGTWTSGLNPRDRTRCKGAFGFIKVSSTTRWAMIQIPVKVEQAGMVRVR